MRVKKESLRPAVFIFVIVLFVLFVYAIIRYNVLKGVELAHLPLYISNKAIAVAAVVLMGISYLLGPLARIWPQRFGSKMHLRKHLGLLGFGLAALHGVISFLLFNSAYYPKFFTEGGKLNLDGELSMLFGVLAFFIFSLVAITSLPAVERSMSRGQWQSFQRSGYLALLLVLLHVLVMGWQGWLKPGDWPGGLLPMSLISFTVLAFVLLMRIAVQFSWRRS